MLAPPAFVDQLRREGVTFFTGVPDSLLKDLCACVNATCAPTEHVIAANEGNAIALATGYYFATGRPAFVYLQNSGLGNTVNPLTSLADVDVYAVPMLLAVGWRAEPGVPDEPQHVTQGRISPRLLETLEIPYWVVDASNGGAALAEACARMREASRPVCLLVKKGTFASYKAPAPAAHAYPMCREDAIRAVAAAAGPADVIVTTTGFASRELYELRSQQGGDAKLDFLTIGCMGHASSIAAGICLGQPERKVVCLDGDGAMLMHMGALPVIAGLAPPNFVHVVLNNGCHESVGGQPTAGMSADLAGIARASGYRSAGVVEQAEPLTRSVREALSTPGPHFIEVRLRAGTRGDLGRPKSKPVDNKVALMRALAVR